MALWLPPSSVAQESAESPRDPYVAARRRLVQTRIANAGVTDSRVLAAIERTPRHEFVPLSEMGRAYYDMALPIGYSQTISSPFIVASMTEALDPQPDDRVLEIGTGSGYQAAVLASLVAEVYTIEIVRPLGKTADETLQKLGYDNVHTRIGDGFIGWPEAAPFDKIIVTCSPESVPVPLVEQLREGGQMIIPVGERYQQTMYRMVKRDGELIRQPLRPTLFVPMTGQAETTRSRQPDPKNPTVINGDFEAGAWSRQPEPAAEKSDAAASSETASVETPEIEAPKIEGPTIESPRIEAATIDGGGPASSPDADDNPYIEGWYYGRQVRLIESPQGRFARFENAVPGLGSHLLQGLAVDGRHVRSARLAASCRTEGVRVGPDADALPMLAITFYDEIRSDLGTFRIGPFRGTRPWREISRIIQIPPAAREAIVRIGLFGATGVADFDNVAFEPRR